MNNTEEGIIRLQPRQLYEMVMAYRYQYPMCTNDTYLDRFGMYIDRESIKHAVKDFNTILNNNHDPIKVVQGPIAQRAEGEKHIPYLHDTYEHNECYTKIIGLDKIVGEVTFHKVLRLPQENLQEFSRIILETLANDEPEGYNISDLNKLKEINFMHTMSRINTGKDEN
jgi:hypothetical protein